ncbi:hypothetical protein KEJ18_04100 [Candidatus Bathyarchaeota archaeon]|nr:hypothetical protein [Candidatus Bathyarchaeota archaeon]
MVHADLIALIDSFLDSEEKKLESLQNSLRHQKISQSTFDMVEKRIRHGISLAADLKEAIKVEEGCWQSGLLDVSRILEMRLLEFQHKFLLGEIGENEFAQKSVILSQGLTSLMEPSNSKAVKVPEVTQSSLAQVSVQTLPLAVNPETIEPIQRFQENIVESLEPIINETLNSSVACEEQPSKPAQLRRSSNGEQSSSRRRKPLSKEPSDLGTSVDSALHCMNPWKPECRNTDIELSIYYKGRPTPICHKCWEDISNKNFEWSSL